MWPAESARPWSALGPAWRDLQAVAVRPQFVLHALISAASADAAAALLEEQWPETYLTWSVIREVRLDQLPGRSLAVLSLLESEWSVLDALRGGPITVVEAADRAGLHPASARRSLVRLETLRLARRLGTGQRPASRLELWSAVGSRPRL